MQSLRNGLRLSALGGRGRRSLASFAEMYRHCVSNAPVRAGDPLVGQVVGQRRGRTARQRFYVLDFGLKTEAPFASREIPGASAIGSRVALPLVELEDAFDEPALDYHQQSALPALQAERFGLLTGMAPGGTHLLHGRFTVLNRGGATVKALGAAGFVPRHHVLSLDRPLLGSHAPFYVLSVSAHAARRRPAAATGAGEIIPVLSSYGGYLFPLANLVGSDAQWRASGGGSPLERLAYLRLLTRVLYVKNAAVRKIMPRFSDADARLYRRQDSRESDMLDPVRNDGQHSQRSKGKHGKDGPINRRGAWLDSIQSGRTARWERIWGRNDRNKRRGQQLNGSRPKGKSAE